MKKTTFKLIALLTLVMSLTSLESFSQQASEETFYADSEPLKVEFGEKDDIAKVMDRASGITSEEDDIDFIISETKSDYLVSLLGDSTEVTITAVEAETIAYTKPGSSIPYSISKDELAYVVFANGEKLEFNPLAGDPSNARSIVMTDKKQDIKGLEYVGEVVVRQHVLITGEGKNSHDTAKLKAQQETMALGGKVLYITKEKLISLPATMWVVKGEAYK